MELSASIGHSTNNVNNVSETLNNSINQLLAIVAKESRGKEKAKPTP